MRLKRRSKFLSVRLPVLLMLFIIPCNCAEQGSGSNPAVPVARKMNPPPDDPMIAALFKRVEWAQENGAHATALALCDQIAKKAPNYDYVYFLRGQILTTLNRHAEAQAAFEKTLTINPAFPAIYFNLGNNALQRGRFREALHFYEKEQAALQPNDPLTTKRAVLLQIGKAHRELGENELARVALLQALQINENFDEAYDELGRVYEDEGDLEKAYASRHRALELKPANLDYSYYLGAVLVKLGRYSEAITHLEKVRAQRPWFYGVYYNLGRSLIATGHAQEGQRYLAMVDSLQNRNAQLGVAKTNAEQHNTRESWLVYARMLEHDQRYAEALAAYQSAQAFAPRDSAVAQVIFRLRELLAVKSEHSYEKNP